MSFYDRVQKDSFTMELKICIAATPSMILDSAVQALSQISALR